MCISLEGTSCWCQEDTQSKQGTTSQPAYYFLQVVKFVVVFFFKFTLGEQLSCSSRSSQQQANKHPCPGMHRGAEIGVTLHTQGFHQSPPELCNFALTVEWWTDHRTTEWGGNFWINSCPSHPSPGGLVGIITPQKPQGFGSCFSLWCSICLIAKNPLISRLNIFIAASSSVLVG